MDRKQPLLIFLMIVTILAAGVTNVNASPYQQDETVIELVTERNEETITETTTETEMTASVESYAEENPEDQIEEAEVDNTEEDTEPEETPEPPEAPVPENPQGERLSKQTGFYWAPSKNAYYYDVHWQNDRGYEGSVQLYADDWTCGMNRCIVYTELPSDGNYTWTVSAVNEAGTAASDEMTFSVPSRIPTADAYRPNAAWDNQRPLIFEWEDVGYSVSDYRIQVVDAAADQICMDVRFSSEAMKHVNGVCYLETEIYFPSGSYVWRVQGVNGSSVSNWSDWTAFSVNCTECNLGTYVNSNSAAVFPNGVTTSAVPQFAWRAVTGAQNYQIELKDSKGAIILDQSIPSSNCQVELCSFTPELTLTDRESYTWTIMTYGWNDSFWGEANSAFSYIAPNIEMNDISFVGPESNASLDPDNQQVIWTDPGETTAAFRIGIRDKQGEWAFISDLSREAAWCDGITCSIQFYEIPEGDNYEIVVIPYSEFNTAGNAISLFFSNQPESESQENPEG